MTSTEPNLASKKLLRVVRWTTGNVGKRPVSSILANPHFEWVGYYAWSPAKAAAPGVAAPADLSIPFPRGIVS